MFLSYFMGGFESATHCGVDRVRVDAIAESHHDLYCEQDYRLLQSVGVRTVRDALRWHRIEAIPGEYDWTTFLAMLDVARHTGTQVLWDLCHWGVPDWISPFSPDFAHLFQRFAERALGVLQQYHHEHALAYPPTVCPIYEISFWSWVGGDEAYFAPYGRGRGFELKQQLVRAANAAIGAMRRMCPELCVLQPEPMIHISHDRDRPEEAEAALGHSAAQFQAWDMLLGRQCPELGGAESNVDVLGVNYYWNNQWVHNGPKTPPGHPAHRPLHRMLLDVWERYRKPLFLSETSAEGDAGAGWLGYVMAEVRAAERLGVPVSGVCIYPVMDYAGWDDKRHCPIGLIELAPGMRERKLRGGMVDELRIQQSWRSRLDG